MAIGDGDGGIKATNIMVVVVGGNDMGMDGDGGEEGREVIGYFESCRGVGSQWAHEVGPCDGGVMVDRDEKGKEEMEGGEGMAGRRMEGWVYAAAFPCLLAAKRSSCRIT